MPRGGPRHGGFIFVEKIPEERLHLRALCRQDPGGAGKPGPAIDGDPADLTEKDTGRSRVKGHPRDRHQGQLLPAPDGEQLLRNHNRFQPDSLPRVFLGRKDPPVECDQVPVSGFGGNHRLRRLAHRLGSNVQGLLHVGHTTIAIPCC